MQLLRNRKHIVCSKQKSKKKKKIWNMYWRFPVLSQRLKSTLFEIFFKWRLRNDKKKEISNTIDYFMIFEMYNSNNL